MMDLYGCIDKMERQYRRYSQSKQTFDGFLADAADFFDGQRGLQRNPQIRITRPDEPSPNHFDLEYLGRSFSARFSAQIQGDELIGELALYETDMANPSTYLKRAECHIKPDGTVTDIEGYEHEDGDPLQIGHGNRPANIYVILSMAMDAVAVL
jgi:hypothetical protein